MRTKALIVDEPAAENNPEQVHYFLSFGKCGKTVPNCCLSLKMKQYICVVILKIH